MNFHSIALYCTTYNADPDENVDQPANYFQRNKINCNAQMIRGIYRSWSLQFGKYNEYKYENTTNTKILEIRNIQIQWITTHKWSAAYIDRYICNLANTMNTNTKHTINTKYTNTIDCNAHMIGMYGSWSLQFGKYNEYKYKNTINTKYTNTINCNAKMIRGIYRSWSRQFAKSLMTA